MKLKTLLFPYDVYSRHKIISELIGKSETVLDVGGSLKELKEFLPQTVILFTTDIVGGDVISTGTALPFKTNSVDIVVSIDTLEHIPKSVRQQFLYELTRVAKKQVILAAPLGTQAHSQAEKKELDRQKRAQEKPDQYLIDHVKWGLPTLEEMKYLVKDFSQHELLFSGNFSSSRTLFRLHRSELKLKFLGRVWYFLKQYIFAIINLTLFYIEKQVPLSQKVNRFYLSIKLQ